MKKPRLLPHKLLLKWFLHQINAEFLHGWELGTAENGPIVFFLSSAVIPLEMRIKAEKAEKDGSLPVAGQGVCNKLGSIDKAFEQARQVWSRWSRWVGERDKVPMSVLGANWAENCGVLQEPLKLFLSWSESSMGASYSFKMKLFAHTMNQPDHSNLQHFAVAFTPHTAISQRNRLFLTGSHTNPPHPGVQTGPFLPQAPSPLMRLWSGGTSE